MPAERLTPEDQVLSVVSRTIQRLRARPQVYLTDEGKERIEALRLKFRAGSIDAEELQAELLGLGMPKSQVDAIVDNELARKAAGS